MKIFFMILSVSMLSCSTNRKSRVTDTKERLPASVAANLVSPSTVREGQREISQRHREEARNLLEGVRARSGFSSFLQRARDGYNDLQTAVSNIRERGLPGVREDMKRVGQLATAMANQQIKKVARDLGPKIDSLKEGIQKSLTRADNYKKVMITKAVVLQAAENLAHKAKDEAGRIARENLTNLLGELQREGTLPRYLFQDFQNLETELRLDNMELEMMSGEIKRMIDKSLLGKYIQEKEESILSQVCERASQCAHNTNSVINSDQRDQIEDIRNNIILPRSGGGNATPR